MSMLIGYQPLTQSSVREHRRSEGKSAAILPETDAADGIGSSIPMPHLLMQGPPPLEPCPTDKAHEWHGCDIVQFSSAIYYVEEEERAIEVDIMRIGTMQGEVEVSYHTEDGTAKAGIRYEGSEGRIVMKDGESNHALRMNILDDEGWANVAEFSVHLTGPEVNCERGARLSACRVKIIDCALFPSDKYRHELEAGTEEIRKIPQLGFIWEYIKLNCAAGMLSPCILILVFDQLANLYLLFAFHMKIYLVDKVLASNSSQDMVRRDLLVYVILYFVPVLALHLWQRARIKLSVQGGSRKWLQSNLFTKYLDYSVESLSEHSSGKLHGSLFTDSPNIAEGFTRLLGLGQKLGKIAILTYIMIKKDPSSCLIAISIPVTMLIFGCMMDKVLQQAAENKDDSFDELVDIVDETAKKITLVADYFQRPKMNQLFNARVGKYNAGVSHEALLSCHCNNCHRYVSSVAVAIFIVSRGPAAVSGEMSLGVFLALIGVFGKITIEYGTLFIEVSTVKRLMYVGLKDVAEYMNLETDLHHLKKVSRERRRVTKSMRQDALSQTRSAPFPSPPSDRLPFELRCISLWPPEGVPILLNTSLAAHQGSLICIAGAHGSGRASVMRLLAHKLFPNTGMIFIPTHCNILHVSREPYILNLSAWENLCFGNVHIDDGLPQRVKEVLQRLEMSRIQKYVNVDLAKKTVREDDTFRRKRSSRLTMRFKNGVADEEDDTFRRKRSSRLTMLFKNGVADEKHSPDQYGECWHASLSESEKYKLHLARAFIMNPEVLVIQRPFSHFNTDTSCKIMELIRLHMHHRGIGLPLDTAGRRRPRTVFFTAERQEQENKADVIWRLDGNKSMTSSLGHCQASDLPRSDSVDAWAASKE